MVHITEQTTAATSMEYYALAEKSQFFYDSKNSS